jgi:cytochrome c556
MGPLSSLVADASMQLSAQLKTRLSYAMVKVQNGWEKRSLDDLEDETSQRGSPIPNSGRSEGARPTIWGSPPSTIRPRRPSALSDASDHVMLTPNQRSPPEVSRSLGATPASCKSCHLSSRCAN